MADMHMAREDQIDPTARKTGHRHIGAPDHRTVIALRQIEGVVGHDDPRDVLAGTLEPCAAARDLLAIDPSPLDDVRAGRVDAENGDLLIGVEGLGLLADIAPILRQGAQPAREDIVHGHVVIARHDDLRRGKLVEIAARRGEFPAPGALRQIAGNDDDIGLGVPDGARQGGQHGIVQPAEMQIREMGKDAQARLPLL